MQPPFVGPSYNLESRPASVQRTVNMVPVPLEPGNERAGWVLKDVPGLSHVTQPDPSFASIGYLLHFNDTSQPRVYPDVKGNAWARDGSGSDSDIFIQGATAKFGAGALAIRTRQGTSSYCSMSAVSAIGDYALVAGNKFTIEAWIYWTGNVDSRPIFGRVVTPTGSVLASIEFYTTNQLKFRTELAALDERYVSPPLNQWVHLAMTYDGTTKRWFVNGALAGSAAIAVGATKAVRSYAIGGVTSGNAFAPDAYLDEARFTFNVCRYTAAFTPPIDPFPDK